MRIVSVFKKRLVYTRSITISRLSFVVCPCASLQQSCMMIPAGSLPSQLYPQQQRWPLSALAFKNAKMLHLGRVGRVCLGAVYVG